MELAKERFAKLVSDERIHKNRVRVTALGKLDMLPHDVQEALNNAMERTKEYDSFYLNVCMAYGSKSEVVDAVKAIGRKIKSGDIDPETITYDTIHQHLLTGEVPDPDLIIRTGGEARLSNFLLLQAAYAELFFTDVYLPAFRKIDFLRIIRDFQRRDRRYGV
jgi:tritrans,polycis-undecaprenyl-diphosphate synthase [geranylgeranyl-diphosphate specific]